MDLLQLLRREEVGESLERCFRGLGPQQFLGKLCVCVCVCVSGCVPLQPAVSRPPNLWYLGIGMPSLEPMGDPRIEGEPLGP